LELDIKMAQQWFNEKVKDDLYSMLNKYTAIFQSVYHSYGQDIETYKCKAISFSASELKLIFKLQQISSALREANSFDFRVDRLIELAEAVKDPEVLIAECNYFFIQAYISFIHHEINGTFDVEDLPSKVEERLVALAQLSADLADFYGSQYTGYKDIQNHTTKQSEYIDEQSNNLGYLLCNIDDYFKVSSTTREDLIQGIIAPIKKSYCEIDSLCNRSDGSWINSYEYLGYLVYCEDEHPLYQPIFDELEREIQTELESLSLPDLFKLLRYDVHSIIYNADIRDLRDWDAVKSLILSSLEFVDLVQEIKSEFMRDVPDYNPE